MVCPPRSGCPRHGVATSSFERVLSGTYGHLQTSSHVFVEAVTLTRARTGSYDDARRIADRILGANDYPAVTELLVVSRDRLRDALEAFDRYRDHPLSFTDATTIALMEEHAIDHLLTFDDELDGIVDRLEPGDF